jgi:hypothetical protein
MSFSSVSVGIVFPLAVEDGPLVPPPDRAADLESVSGKGCFHA